MPSLTIALIGHVDAGKTTLAKALSTSASTCAFDKHPQSQQRGITIDLGFSQAVIQNLLVTIVDCPGHASLFRAVLLAANIIDVFVLVVDSVQGVQEQTIEALALVEMHPEKPVVIALSKCDDGLSKHVKLHVALTNKLPNATIVKVSAKAGDVAELHRVLLQLPAATKNHLKSLLPLCLIEHCFVVKGAGLVVTGTVLQGSIQLNDSLMLDRSSVKVKGIQMFKQDVTSAAAGDRVGINLVGCSVNDILSERTLLSHPSLIRPAKRVLIRSAKRVGFFKGEITAEPRYHCSILCATVMTSRVYFVKGHQLFDAFEDGMDVLVAFEDIVSLLEGSKCVLSRMDLTGQCRLCLHGQAYVQDAPVNLEREKIKNVVFERTHKEDAILCRGLNRNKIGRFLQHPVLSDGDVVGHIVTSFGNTNKFVVSLQKTPFVPSAPLYLKYRKSYQV